MTVANTSLIAHRPRRATILATLAATLTVLACATLAAGATGVRPPVAADAGRPLAGTAKHMHNGRIVFQAYVGRSPQLFTIKPDGKGLRQITHVPAKDPANDPGAENPEWSPDGATIAFDTGNAKGVTLFTVRANASALTKLALSVGAFNGDPAYSPDGKQISFDQDIGPSQPNVHGIFVANADGSMARRVTTGIPSPNAFDTESQWSPDGKQLAFTRVKNHRQAAVFVVNLDGTGLRRLTPWRLDAASPDWSRDGTKILFNSYFDYRPGKSSTIYSIRPDGSHRIALTDPRAGAQSFRPSWSPDGTRILFTRFTPIGKAGRVDLYTMSPIGTALRRVTNMPQAGPTNADWGTAP